jgi:hypothetical protein
MFVEASPRTLLEDPPATLCLFLVSRPLPLLRPAPASLAWALVCSVIVTPPSMPFLHALGAVQHADGRIAVATDGWRVTYPDGTGRSLDLFPGVTSSGRASPSVCLWSSYADFVNGTAALSAAMLSQICSTNANRSSFGSRQSDERTTPLHRWSQHFVKGGTVTPKKSVHGQVAALGWKLLQARRRPLWLPTARPQATRGRTRRTRRSPGSPAGDGGRPTGPDRVAGAPKRDSTRAMLPPRGRSPAAAPAATLDHQLVCGGVAGWQEQRVASASVRRKARGWWPC